jgi:broad specificity phosphatase PhoE
VAETTILLVRHGETDWNAERRVQGKTDRPLNETGRDQAQALAQQLAGVPLAAVYSSDLGRALETARTVADARKLQVTPLRELRERDFGTWEGLTDVEILERYPEARTGSWGDAETRDELEARVLAAIRRISEDHPGETVLVVAHGGPLRAMLAHASGDGGGPIPNCHVLELAFRDGRFEQVDRTD